MITHTIMDATARVDGGTTDVPRGTPVAFLDFTAAGDSFSHTGGHVVVELPDGREARLPAAAVYSQADESEREETLPELAERLGIKHNSLLVAVRDGRVLARKSGGTWLTTELAVKYAMEAGTFQPRETP